MARNMKENESLSPAQEHILRCRRETEMDIETDRDGHRDRSLAVTGKVFPRLV